MVRTDLFSENDVYAVVMLEGHVVQTLTLMDARHPRWNPEDARAIRLPVWSPMATLYVALFDADFSQINHDDPLGRVEIEPRTLNPETVYTSWLPLHRRLRSNSAPCGNIRLRYSVSWNSLPQRLLSYTLRPPTELTIAFSSSADKSRATFTAVGIEVDRRYNWNQLQAYIDELLATLELLKEPFEGLCATMVDLMSYQKPIASLAVCIGWQLFCFAPGLFLSLLPLTLTLGLSRSYIRSRDASPELHQPPSVWESWKCVLLPGKWGRPTAFRFIPTTSGSSPLDGTSQSTMGTTDAALMKAGVTMTEVVAAEASAATPEASLATPETSAATTEPTSTTPEGSVVVVSDAVALDVATYQEHTTPRRRIPLASAVDQAHAALLVSMAEVVQENVVDANNGSQEAKQGKWQRALTAVAEAASDTTQAIVNLDAENLTINPLAVYLGPVQRIIGEYMVFVRALRALYVWEDPVLTGWVCVTLLLASGLLPLIPWLLLLRLAGAALFGPHQYFLDRHRRYVAQKEAEEEERYQAASDDEARQMVEERLVERRRADPSDTDLLAAAEAGNDSCKCCGGGCFGTCDSGCLTSCSCASLCGSLKQRRSLKAAQHTLTIGVMPRFLQATLPELHRSTARALREDQMGLEELDGTADFEVSSRTEDSSRRARAMSATEMAHLL